MMHLAVENKPMLLDSLRSIDIVGPLANDYRKKDATEPYAMAHLLSSLAEVPNALAFPLELVHREPPDDKPDFVLSIGKRRIGIEHADARPESETRKNDMRNREGIGPSAYFVTPVEPDGPRRSAQQLREKIEANDPRGGWGDQSQTDTKWAQVMLAFIDCKEHKLKQYSRYDEDWLLIRDAWPCPSLNHANATKCLCEQIRDRDTMPQFHRIFIISNTNSGPICEISQAGVHLHPRNDLWLTPSA